MLNFEWILVVFGLNIIITLSKLTQPIRTLGKKLHPSIGVLLSCPMCFGFWAAAIINLLGYSHYGEYYGATGVLFDGFLGTATGYFLHAGSLYLSKELS